jgi:glutaredoxin
VDLKNFLFLILIVLCSYLGYQQLFGRNICLIPLTSNEQTDNGVTINPESSNSNERTSNEITLYTTSWCSSCKTTKAFLEKKGLKYINYDIEKSKEGRERHKVLVKPFRIKGGVGVPLIVVNGISVLGFSESQILAALKREHQ